MAPKSTGWAGKTICCQYTTKIITHEKINKNCDAPKFS